MPKDADLDRLRASQDRAFEQKQAAWDYQNQAWERRSAAREAMDQAYHQKQQAYDVQQAAWEDLQRVRGYNGPRINQLNARQEVLYQQMKSAFDRASSAYDARDGAAAKAYANEGHGYKADAQSVVSERRQLVQEIRNAKARHDNTRPAFQQAKAEFDRAKAYHNQIKADHERKRDEFVAAKNNFESAKNAFHARLEAVQAESQRRRDDRRDLAQKAGIPSQYADSSWVTTKTDGTVHIYFGGEGAPDGPGHGHYVMDASGSVAYRREPFESHGAHNHTSSKDGGSQWNPRGSEAPQVGVIAGTDHVVSFKTGGPTGDHTLIADGDFSENNRGFKGSDEQRGHNHYGSRAEKDPEDPDKWIDDQDRGKYTGPDH